MYWSYCPIDLFTHVIQNPFTYFNIPQNLVHAQSLDWFGRFDFEWNLAAGILFEVLAQIKFFVVLYMEMLKSLGSIVPVFFFCLFSIHSTRKKISETFCKIIYSENINLLLIISNRRHF